MYSSALLKNIIVCILDMGNNDSKQKSTEQKGNFISRYINDLISPPSEFYYAYQMGNADRVRELLPTVAYNKKVCQLEPNGDMALHAAIRADHASIVALLLANGFSRIAINKESKTAYELAPNDEIRSLFHRPISELQARLTDKDANETLNILDLNEDTDNQAVYNSPEEAIQSRYMARFNRRPKLLRNIVKTMTEARSMETFEKLVREFQSLCDIKTGDQILLKNSFEEFLKTKNINKLIHLYTLNDLYKTIREHVSACTTLVYLNLSSLSQRADQGICYRGVGMTLYDVSRYYYAMKTPNSVVETRNFSSTSQDKQASIIYSGFGASRFDNLHSILLVFEFPTSCNTAINLSRTSEHLPPLSQFQDEDEVLILPYTLFKVVKVVEATETEPFLIYLQNVPVPEKSPISFLKEKPKYIA
jgi:hypothetical protein